MAVTIIVEYADRELHGSLSCKQEQDSCPGRVRPCSSHCKQRNRREYEHNRLYVGELPKAHKGVSHTPFLRRGRSIAPWYGTREARLIMSHCHVLRPPDPG